MKTDKKYQSIRLFKSPFLEALTHVHPIIPLFMWGPFVLFLIWRSATVHQLNLGEWALFSFLGILVWTFAEYALHRWVFHFEAKGKWGERFVFLFHGIHHDDPVDPTRLVMPPFPAIVIMALLYFSFSLFIGPKHIEAFMAFFTIGYLCYYYIHYATHHFPMTGKVARYLKKYHLQHHYSKQEAKYGVSNPLWDYIFNTVTGPIKSHK